MDYQKILGDLVTGKLTEYKVEPKNAFAFQAALRDFGKRQDIKGRAQRGGTIIYSRVNSDD